MCARKAPEDDATEKTPARAVAHEQAFTTCLQVQAHISLRSHNTGLVCQSIQTETMTRVMFELLISLKHLICHHDRLCHLRQLAVRLLALPLQTTKGLILGQVQPAH